MIDFSRIALVKAEGSGNSYVGLMVKNGNLFLKLPIGGGEVADDIMGMGDEERYEKIKEVYFCLYSVLRVYSAVGGSASGKIVQEISGAQNRSSGRKLISYEIDRSSLPSLIFSNLDRLFSVLETMNDEGLHSVVERLNFGQAPELRNFGKLVKNATFIEGDVAYIDNFLQRKGGYSSRPSDIVGICCFIFSEVLEQLQKEVPSHIKSMANDYREKYVGHSNGLFHFQMWRKTRDQLRENLEMIYKSSAYKDDRFMGFYDAADHFLNGAAKSPDEQIIWGMSGFSHVWEAVCAEYIRAKRGKIVFADTGNIRKKLREEIGFHRHYQKISSNIIPMKPDFIWDNGAGQYEISDAKYKISLENEDYIKQFVYSWVLQRCSGDEYKVGDLEFILPSTQGGDSIEVFDISVLSVSEYMASFVSEKSNTAKEIQDVVEDINKLGSGLNLHIKGINFKITRINIFDALRNYVTCIEAS